MLKITETRQTAYIQQGCQSGERVTTNKQNFDLVDQMMSQGIKTGLSPQLSAGDPHQPNAGSVTQSSSLISSPVETFASTQTAQDGGLSFDVQDKLTPDQELLRRDRERQTTPV